MVDLAYNGDFKYLNHMTDKQLKKTKYNGKNNRHQNQRNNADCQSAYRLFKILRDRQGLVVAYYKAFLNIV